MKNLNNNKFSIYDLSNQHYHQVTITTKEGKEIDGQFVKFKVIMDIVEHYYPIQKLCFLPQRNKKEFWDFFNSNNGEIKEIPQYILMISMNEISKITIFPI